MSFNREVALRLVRRATANASSVGCPSTLNPQEQRVKAFFDAHPTAFGESNADARGAIDSLLGRQVLTPTAATGRTRFALYKGRSSGRFFWAKTSKKSIRCRNGSEGTFKDTDKLDPASESDINGVSDDILKKSKDFVDLVGLATAYGVGA